MNDYISYLTLYRYMVAHITCSIHGQQTSHPNSVAYGSTPSPPLPPPPLPATPPGLSRVTVIVCCNNRL